MKYVAWYMHTVCAALLCGDYVITLLWRYNGCNGVSNHRRPNCLMNRLPRRRSKKTSKFCVTGLCEGNSPVTGEFPAQKAENVSIWWRHHELERIRVIDFPFPSGSLDWHWIHQHLVVIAYVCTCISSLLPVERGHCNEWPLSDLRDADSFGIYTSGN